MIWTTSACKSLERSKATSMMSLSRLLRISTFTNSWAVKALSSKSITCGFMPFFPTWYLIFKFNEIVLNCNENDYAYIYVPNKSSTRIAVDGLVGGFFLIGTVQLHSLTYYVFKSANSGLGELFINIL